MPYKITKGGGIEETGAKEIPLSLSKENLKQLLSNIIESNTQYSHQDFCNWCSEHFGNIVSNDLELEAMGIDEATYEVLNDIDAQWGLFLVNTYSMKELQVMDLSHVCLPKEWFEGWLNRLAKYNIG